MVGCALEAFCALALGAALVCSAQRIVLPEHRVSALRLQQASSPPSVRTHAESVADYTLHATLDPSTHQIHGSGTIGWRNVSHVPIDELYVHLYMNAFKSASTTFMMERLGPGRGVGPLSDPGWIDVSRFVVRELGDTNVWPNAVNANPTNADDLTDMRVPLSTAIEPDQVVHIDVEWTTQLPSIVERTGHYESFHMAGKWFPKIAKLDADGSFAHFPFHHLSEFYADFGSYDVTIQTPSRS